MRTALGVSVLAFQLVMIGYARFVPSRYFCWAPYDSQNHYEMEVTVDGKRLDGNEIRQRYRRPQKGINNRAIQHEKDIIIQYERTYGRNENAEVTLRYRTNGGEEQLWRWPPQ